MEKYDSIEEFLMLSYSIRLELSYKEVYQTQN